MLLFIPRQWLYVQGSYYPSQEVVLNLNNRCIMFLASLKERWGLFQIIYNTYVTDLILFIGDVHIQSGFKSAVCREELGLQQQQQPQCCHLVAFFSLRVSRTINCSTVIWSIWLWSLNIQKFSFWSQKFPMFGQKRQKRWSAKSLVIDASTPGF